MRTWMDGIKVTFLVITLYCSCARCYYHRGNWGRGIPDLCILFLTMACKFIIIKIKRFFFKWKATKRSVQLENTTFKTSLSKTLTTELVSPAQLIFNQRLGGDTGTLHPSVLELLSRPPFPEHTHTPELSPWWTTGFRGSLSIVKSATTQKVENHISSYLSSQTLLTGKEKCM